MIVARARMRTMQSKLKRVPHIYSFLCYFSFIFRIGNLRLLGMLFRALNIFGDLELIYGSKHL